MKTENTTRILPVLLVFALAFAFVVAPALAAAENETSTSLGADVDKELQEYDSTTIAQEQSQLSGIIQNMTTDVDQLAKENGLTETEKSEFKNAAKSLGEKQYVRNVQFKMKLAVAGVQSETIIAYLKNLSINTSDLESIVQKLQDIRTAVNIENLTGNEFSKKLSDAKDLAKQFRDTVRAELNATQLNELREKIKTADNDETRNLTQKENKVRTLYNEKE